jgi:hypothetical protein
MPWVGFESTIAAFERAKTVHALDRAATVVGILRDIRLQSNCENVLHPINIFMIYTSYIYCYGSETCVGVEGCDAWGENEKTEN